VSRSGLRALPTGGDGYSIDQNWKVDWSSAIQREPLASSSSTRNHVLTTIELFPRGDIVPTGGRSGRLAPLLHSCGLERIPAMSNFPAIPTELLLEATGGRQTVNELSAFARERGFTVTSTTGGNHLGWAHRAGRAIDVRTRGQSSGAIDSFMRDARGRGITVIDERRGGNSAWSGPHLHLQK
jgi:hypothetical protein